MYTQSMRGGLWSSWSANDVALIWRFSDNLERHFELIGALKPAIPITGWVDLVLVCVKNLASTRRVAAKTTTCPGGSDVHLSRLQAARSSKQRHRLHVGVAEIGPSKRDKVFTIKSGGAARYWVLHGDKSTSR